MNAISVIEAAPCAQRAQRLDLPPPAGARIAPPAGFGRRFIIFGDAEEEFDWSAPFDRSATSTTAIAALPEANRHFVAAGVVPTYLVDHPVVANPASAAAMAAMTAAGECDIGAQLHPWVTPPHSENVNPSNSFTGNLPVRLQHAKLAELSAAIERGTGVRPLAYRAGRYGVGPDTAALLVEEGYRLDVSVRALFDYSDQGGPDFSRHPCWPYRVASGLIEQPLTAAWIGPLHRYPRLRRAPFLRLCQRRAALTPEGVTLTDALEAIRVLLDTDLPVFSLSFHTPSVEPGHTPYVRDADDLRRFWAWWDGVFDAFARAGVTSIRSGALIEAFG